MNRRLLTALTLLAPLALAACHTSPPPARPARPVSTDKLAPATCGSLVPIHDCAGIFLASQPAPADFQKLKDEGLRTVINLRPEGENKDFDEPRLMSELGLRYISIPFGSPDQLTDSVITRARDMLSRAEKPLLLHCHTGNRVGAIWLAYRVLDGGLPYADALAEAKLVGLKAPALEAKAKSYIDRELAFAR